MNGGVAAKFVNTLMGGPAIGPFSYIYVDGQRGYRGIEIITPAENVTHKKVTLAKVTAKNDPPESTRKNATGKYPEIFGTIRIFSHVMREIVNTRRDPIGFSLTN